MSKNEIEARTNWFDAGGHDYAKFRPEYPPELARLLREAASANDLALDVGCGNGQLTAQLAEHFKNVVGVDPSAEQIQNAKPLSGVQFLVAPAEKLPLADSQANLITAAQSAHWFDLPAFFEEVRRVAAKDAVVALISYGIMELEPALNDRFNQFYWDEIGPFWPQERKLVDSGYADILFPFPERITPKIAMEKRWNLSDLLGYVSTWSAVKSAGRAGKQHMLTTFASDLTALWGDPSTLRTVTWPLNIRLGDI